MRNLLDETPEADTRGRLDFSNRFVGADRCRDAAILDIGCGFGWFERFALEAGARSIVGIEPSEEDLKAARRGIDDTRASFTSGSVLELPFPAETYDIVVMWEVLEHLPVGSEPEALREIARVLRPDGSLFLSTPNAAVIAELTDPARWLIGHRHYRPEAVAKFASDAGLQPDRVIVRGGYWEIALVTMFYACKWLLRRRPFFEDALRVRVDREWRRDSGLTNVLVEARKPAKAA
jgi:SAM-dependent methyltransferase